MAHPYDIVKQLTSAMSNHHVSPVILNDFAFELGWQPSDQIDVPAVRELANAHLLVEHGLENTALISFLSNSWNDLTLNQQRRLLSVSYNNLVDWHIQVQSDAVTFVHNRTNPLMVVNHPISRSDTTQLRSEAFEQIADQRPNPNLPALDEALIETISKWKRNLSAEMNNNVTNESLSALFNAIIFVRAIEDWRRFHSGDQTADQHLTLLDIWERSAVKARTLQQALHETMTLLTGEAIPSYIGGEELLGAFDSLDQSTAFAVLADFYRNRYYQYDFSIISKHALSRIYEHYVSILRPEESPQLTLPLFTRLPEEERDKAYGGVYTPQFIARFFARYLREQMPPLAFQRLTYIDPACGSGIFLRTLLEQQFDPLLPGVTTERIQTAFTNAHGYDADANACHAARLSLALLHLVLTDRLPDHVNIFTTEAIAEYLEHPNLSSAFDAVIANPPFVALEFQSMEMRQHVATFMGKYGVGRIDTYIAFLRLGLDMIKPGGYGLFVLPHSFLLNDSAREMRNLLRQTSWIRCLADLSAIRVFENTGSYVILLIFQKKLESVPEPPAMIVKCQDLVGQALQDAVEGRRKESSVYSIYDVQQEEFDAFQWVILPPTESRLERKFARLPVLEDFLHVRLGFISGANSVFIVPNSQVPEGEEAIYVPYLADKEMVPYTVPAHTSRRFFYPFLGTQRISEEQLKNGFRETWQYLLSHKPMLSNRPAVQRKQIQWWEPERPRQPEHMMRPKIVSPHLVVVPRFALDLDGKYAVSHAPMLFPKDEGEDAEGTESDLLRLFVAILNSTPCYWYIATHSHKYRSGYAMLEPRTLLKTPVPDPATISATDKRLLLQLVDRRLLSSASEAINLERQIDDLVVGFYDLSSDERRALGLEG